jgi:predicted MFS family arabinose efflux permease
MMASDVLRALVQAFVAVAFFLDRIDVWELAVASSLFGVAAAFFNPASTGLVPSLVSAARLQEANALLNVSRSALQVAGPAVSGIVVATLGFGVVFAVDSASFVASFLCLAAMRLPSKVERGERQSMLAEALEGLRAIRERRWLVATLSCDLVFNLALAAYFVLGPVVVERHFDGARDWGLIMTAGSIGGLVGSALVLRVKPRRPLLAAYTVGFATPLQLLILAPPLPLAVAMLGGGLVFCAIVVANTYWSTMAQQHVPRELISRVDSLSWIASVFVMPAGLVVVGPVAGAIGVGTTLVGAAALAAVALVGALLVREVRELERLDAEPAAEGAPVGA